MADSGAVDRNESRKTIPVVIISGPTASGKSSLAIELARQYKAEIISADSRQIYRQLKIGTDRLDKDQWQGIRHHLMGTVDLGQRFTVFDFVHEANKIITEAANEDRRIIICGGTGLYLRGLTDGIFEIPDGDMSYRHDLLDLASREGPGCLHEMLRRIDPEEAARIHPHNMIRVIRALEIYHLTGRRKSELVVDTAPVNKSLRFLHLVLVPDRTVLYKLIEQRVDEMIEKGLVTEAKSVYESEFKEALRDGKIVGYAELVDYFEGRLSLAEAINLIKQNTRRYAKRQYTWFRGLTRAEFVPGFGSEAGDQSRSLIDRFWDVGPGTKKLDRG